MQRTFSKLLSAVKLSGQCTDSGGGGVLASLANALRKLDVTTPIYLVANCTLHAIQLTLANPGGGTLDVQRRTYVHDGTIGINPFWFLTFAGFSDQMR